MVVFPAPVCPTIAVVVPGVIQKDLIRSDNVAQDQKFSNSFWKSTLNIRCYVCCCNVYHFCSGSSKDHSKLSTPAIRNILATKICFVLIVMIILKIIWMITLNVG